MPRNNRTQSMGFANMEDIVDINGFLDIANDKGDKLLYSKLKLLFLKISKQIVEYYS